MPVKLHPGNRCEVSICKARKEELKVAYDPAVADIIALPFFSPNALVKLDLKFLLRKSLKYGWPPN